MKQRGVALVAGLVLLTAVSLLAVTAANSMNLQRRQTSNAEDALLALNNARLAESWAKAWLFSRADIERQAGCLANCLLPVAIHSPGALPEQPQFQAASWWRFTGIAPAAQPESGAPVSGVGTARGSAYWLLQEMHYEAVPASETEPGIRGIGYYRVFSRGTGINPRSQAVTESILARPWQGEYDEIPFPPIGRLGEFCHQFSSEVPCGTLAWRLLK